MINKDNILKSILGLFNKGQVSFDKRFTNPRREWFIGLLFFVAIVTAGGIYSAQMFVTYRNLSTDGGDYNESLVRYNESLIEEVLSVYQARKESFDTLRNVSVPAAAIPPVVPEPTVSASTSEQVSQELETPVSSTTESSGTDEVLMVN